MLIYFTCEKGHLLKIKHKLGKSCLLWDHNDKKLIRIGTRWCIIVFIYYQFDDIITSWLPLFHLWFSFITFGGRSAHLAYLVHKSGRKTSIIIIIIVTSPKLPKSEVTVIRIFLVNLRFSDSCFSQIRKPIITWWPQKWKIKS